MKRTKEKKQRKGRKKINKSVSSIAKSVAGSEKSHNRQMSKMRNQFPNSQKIGAGSVTAIRQSYNGLHRKNHRTPELIGFKL